MDLFWTRAIGDLVQNDFRDLYLRPRDPSYAAIVEFNLSGKTGGQIENIWRLLRIQFCGEAGEVEAVRILERKL